jgi:tRNA-splicing endonuclease subunit Sen54
MPTLAELTHMYETLPVIPPPLPRKRNPPSEKPVPVLAPKSSPPKVPDPRAHPLPFLARLWSLLPFYSAPPASGLPLARVNPFMALRQGNKSVVIAVVDVGTVSFFRFGQGAFEEWPMA